MLWWLQPGVRFGRTPDGSEHRRNLFVAENRQRCRYAIFVSLYQFLDSTGRQPTRISAAVKPAKPFDSTPNLDQS